MNFQKTTLSVALFVFMLSILILVVQLYQSSVSVKWPPEIADCPDFWLSVGSKSLNTKCQPNSQLLHDTGNWGNFCYKKGDNKYNCSIVDFGVPEFNSKDPETATSAKCYWARTHGVYWTGVTDIGSSCDTKPQNLSNDLDDS